MPKRRRVRYRSIKRFPGYVVGNNGSVWSRWKGRRHKKRIMRDKWKKLKLSPLKSGHLSVRLQRGSKIVTKLVHRLVLEAFVGPCPPGMECRHFPDRNPANNRVENLSWGTRKQNRRDSITHGTSGRPSGENHSRAKLTRNEAMSIQRRYEQGETISKIHKDFSELGFGTIEACAKKRSWKCLNKQKYL